MGWDIVAIGTNHNLPIEDPFLTAERISSLVNLPISVGYYKDWEYNQPENRIERSKTYEWIEIVGLNPHREEKPILFSIEDYCARSLYYEYQRTIGNMKFENSEDRKWFISDATEQPFALYECDSQTSPFFDLRVFKEIVEFTVNFPGRWFQFVHAIKNIHTPPYKDYVHDFRKYIFSQLKVCGCDKAYYFADQGTGEWLYDVIDKSSKEWISYLKNGEYTEDGQPRIIEIRQILNGHLNLSEDDWIDCFIDDFSDFEK